MFTIRSNSHALRSVLKAFYHLRRHPSDGDGPATFEQRVNAALTHRARDHVADAVVAICAYPTANEADARFAKLLVALIGQTCTYPVPGQAPSLARSYSAADTACRTLFARLALQSDPTTPGIIEGNMDPVFGALLIATEAAKPIQQDVDLLTQAADLVGVPEQHAVRDCIAKLASEIPQPAPEHPTAWIIEKASSLSAWQTQIVLDARSNTRQQAWDRFLAVKKANPNEGFRFTALYPQ